jgi:dihydrofolate reductase
MRRVVAAEFVSLDGVMESPDKWHFPYFNEEMGQAVGEGFAAADAMLMGRVNYEEWAAFWPGQDPQENPMAAQMNAMKKYVVSTTLEEPLEWQGRRGRDSEPQAGGGRGHRDLRQRCAGPLAPAPRLARRVEVDDPSDIGG